MNSRNSIDRNAMEHRLNDRSTLRTSASSRRRRKLLERGLERLEDRTLLSSYVVTDPSGGAGSAADVTLPYAVSQAVAHNDANAEISFNLPAGQRTINLTAVQSNQYGPTSLLVGGTAKITIDGSTAPGLVINGGYAANVSNGIRPFAVTGSAALTLEDLTIAGGEAQGGAGASGAGAGGGAAGLGGAIFNDGGTLTIQGCTFTNNLAVGGSGGTAAANASGLSGGGGGGLAAAGASNGQGGGPASDFGGGGTGGQPGGGNGTDGGFGAGGGGEGSAPGIAGHTPGAGGFGGGGGGGGGQNAPSGGAGFGGGNGGIGAAASNVGGAGGGGAGLGGAIFANGGTVTLVNDTFTGNLAVGGNHGTGQAASSQTATNGSGIGGAVFVRSATLRATNVTFSANVAPQGGTDVYVLSDGNASTASGSVLPKQAAAVLIDDILAQASDVGPFNFLTGTTADGFTVNLTGSSNDLVTSNAPGGTGLSGPGIIGGNPLLGALGNNGGNTPTMRPATSPTRSSVLGAGISADFPGTSNAITTDQAGNARPASNPDLGSLQTPPQSSGGAATPAATFVKTDTATAGNWIGTYGADGEIIAHGPSAPPSYAEVSVPSLMYYWAPTTTATRAMALPGTSNRIGTAWYSFTSMTFHVDLTDASAHEVALYLLDWDGNGVRQETIQVYNATTNQLLDTRSAGNFPNGEYLVWALTGDVNIVVTYTGTNKSANAVVSGLFFGGGGAGGGNTGTGGGTGGGGLLGGTPTSGALSTPPAVSGNVVVTRTRKGVPTITIPFNQPLNPFWAANSSLYQVLQSVKKHKKTTFAKPLKIKAVTYNPVSYTVTIQMAAKVKGPMELNILPGLQNTNHVISTAPFSTILD